MTETTIETGTAIDPRSAAWRSLSALPGFGPRALRRALDEDPSTPDLRLGEAAAIAARFRLPPASVRRALAGEALSRARKHIVDDRALGIELLTPWSGLPPQLLELPDPPLLLFRRGAGLAEEQLRVAIVGSRAATYYGLAMAQDLARQLSERGVAIISGLARGIDAAAHRAVLAAGGLGIAVLGHGLHTTYPPENAGLAERLCHRGALLSELPRGVGIRRDHFPRRNRLIAGLAHAVIVVEAAARSGALITARLALEYGREVLAVPGPADAPSSRGPNGLIRDGAALVEHADDVLDALAFTGRAPKPLPSSPTPPPSIRLS